MAIIKTYNTEALARNLGFTLWENSKITAEPVEKIDSFIDLYYKDNYKDGVTEVLGGSNVRDLKETSTRIDLIDTYKNFPYFEYYNSRREESTEKFYLTGSDLTTNLLNSTGHGWSENSRIVGDNWNETIIETSSGKHSYVDDALIVTEFKLNEKSNWNGSYPQPITQNNSSYYNFNGNARIDENLFTIQIKNLASTKTFNEKSGNTSRFESTKLSISSEGGVTHSFDSASMNSFSGSINSINFTNKVTLNDGSDINSRLYSYQSASDLNASGLNDFFSGPVAGVSLSAFLEEILKGDDKITGSSKDENNLYGGAGNDNMTGNSGNDLLMGGTGNDTLKSMAGIDQLYGDQGDDRLDGGAGNDELYGGDGNDHLSGSNGDDILIGGTGKDTLKGSAGADKFSFSFGDSTLGQSTMDTVSDFKIVQNDKLSFSLDFNLDDIQIKLEKADKTLYATYDDLRNSANISDAKIFVGYTAADKNNGYVFVDYNGGGMDMAIKLTGVTSATQISFDSFTNLS